LKPSIPLNSAPQAIDAEEYQKSSNAIRQAVGSAMKRMLAVNDMYGSKAMRESVLAEMNNLNRYVATENDRLCLLATLPENLNDSPQS